LATSRSLIDDRLLVARLVGERVRLPRAELFTTTYWYFRACRAAVLGGSGQLSGPFARLAVDEQAAAIAAMLVLPDDIGLPDPRLLVPEMARMHQRHPQLNVMNLEALGTASLLRARVLLSPRASEGVLPLALEAERLTWRVVAVG
jgi:hypothetical protein